MTTQNKKRPAEIPHYVTQEGVSGTFLVHPSYKVTTRREQPNESHIIEYKIIPGMIDSDGKSTNVMLLNSKTSLKEIRDNGEIVANDLILLAKEITKVSEQLRTMPVSTDDSLNDAIRIVMGKK